ncbi:hypothetical protein D3C83_303340 [compost metagenome]
MQVSFPGMVIQASTEAGGRMAGRAFIEAVTPKIVDTILRINPDGVPDKMRRGLR